MYKYGKIDFEWDSSKEEENILKHKITFAEAVETFFDPSGIQLNDNKHSENEARFYWIGKSEQKKILTTRFTIRGNVIRIIGAAEWRKFKRIYETTKIE